MTDQYRDPKTVRWCEHCLRTKPIEEFRLRYRGRPDRLAQCRECHNVAERVRHAAKRGRMARRTLAKSLTALKNERSDRQVRALCSEMAAQFGGVAGIATEWKKALRLDMAKGGYAAFRHVAAIVRLAEYCEQNRPNYGAMTEAELEGAIVAMGGTLPLAASH